MRARPLLTFGVQTQTQTLLSDPRMFVNKFIIFMACTIFNGFAHSRTRGSNTPVAYVHNTVCNIFY